MSDLNDPRVLFAAERTLFAWNRTGISLMAFGFVVERFELYLHYLGVHQTPGLQRFLSLAGGIGFILLGAFVEFYSVLQYKRILKTLKPAEIPMGYDINTGLVVNVIAGMMGAMLCLYLTIGLF
jgi:putative membrane protein